MPKVGWIVSHGFVANFIRFPAVQKLWKSVKIRQSYRQLKGGNFFSRHSVFSSCGFFFFLLFFLAYSQPSQIGCLPYFHTWGGLSANLECRSGICCMRLVENTGRKNDAKIRHLGTIPQLCPAISSQQRHILTIGRNLLNSNISPRI